MTLTLWQYFKPRQRKGFVTKQNSYEKVHTWFMSQINTEWSENMKNYAVLVNWSNFLTRTGPPTSSALTCWCSSDIFWVTTSLFRLRKVLIFLEKNVLFLLFTNQEELDCCHPRMVSQEQNTPDSLKRCFNIDISEDKFYKQNGRTCHSFTRSDAR